MSAAGEGLPFHKRDDPARCPFRLTDELGRESQCSGDLERPWPGGGSVLAGVAEKLGMPEAAESQATLWTCDMHGRLLSAILAETAASLDVG
jgi:hypothetical protein